MRVSSWCARASRIGDPPFRLIKPCTRIGQRIELLTHVAQPGRDGLAELGDLRRDVRLQLGQSPLVASSRLAFITNQ